MIKVTNGLDFSKTAIINALMHPTASDPATPGEGQLWYNSTTKLLVYYDGSSNVSLAAGSGIGSLVEDPTPQLAGMLDVNGNTIGDGTRELLSFVEDASAVNQLEIENEATGSGPILRATGDDTNVDLEFATKGSGAFNFTGSIGVTGTVDGRDVASDGSKLDGVEAGADVTDAANVAAAGATMDADTSLAGNAYFLDDDTMAANDATKTVSQQSLIAYVASQISTVYTPVAEYDADTNSPDLDTSPSGIVDGEQYVVTVAGTFFTAPVEVGDLLIARQDDPTALAHWVVVNRNLDQATESAAGTAAIASDSDVSTETDDTKIVTPVKLATRLAALFATVTRKYSELVGDGAETDIVVTHNLGTKDVVVSVREISSDEMVIADVVATTTNTVTVSFAVAPSTDTYRVIVVG